MLDFFFGIFKDRFDIQRFSNRKCLDVGFFFF